MNDFEKACNEIEIDRSYEVNCENDINWIRGTKTATVMFSQKRFISKIEKLAEQYPDEVQITARNKTSIVAHIPVSYIKINRRSREFSEEERKAIGERLKSATKHD